MSRGVRALPSLDGDDNEFFTLSELAAYLRVSTRTVKRLKKNGKLPPEIKVGRSLRWPKRAVRKWFGIDEAPPAA